MASNSPGNINTSKIILPVVIGLSIIGWMIWRDVDNDVLENFTFTWRTWLFIGLACLFMVGRDLGYIIRLRLFARGGLSWRKAFRVIMLWEFTSAVTPSAVGGTSIATVFVHKEGLSVGKSAAIVMLTAFFDELYFVIFFPLIAFIVGTSGLFDIELGRELMIFAFIGYGVKFLFLVGLTYGLFINPRGLKWLIVNIFRLPVIRRWKEGAEKAGDDIIISSAEIKKYSHPFWFKAFAATFLSWSSRYLVANMLFMAFFVFREHLLVFARQLVMWIMLLVAPTPGGSGFAEYLFRNFMGDVIPVDQATKMGTAAMIALMWRLITYYPYLVMGAIILPRWLDRSFRKKHADNRKSA